MSPNTSVLCWQYASVTWLAGLVYTWPHCPTLGLGSQPDNPVVGEKPNGVLSMQPISYKVVKSDGGPFPVWKHWQLLPYLLWLQQTAWSCNPVPCHSAITDHSMASQRRPVPGQQLLLFIRQPTTVTISERHSVRTVSLNCRPTVHCWQDTFQFPYKLCTHLRKWYQISKSHPFNNRSSSILGFRK